MDEAGAYFGVREPPSDRALSDEGLERFRQSFKPFAPGAAEDLLEAFYGSDYVKEENGGW